MPIADALQDATRISKPTFTIAARCKGHDHCAQAKDSSCRNNQSDSPVKRNHSPRCFLHTYWEALPAAYIAKHELSRKKQAAATAGKGKESNTRAPRRASTAAGERDRMSVINCRDRRSSRTQCVRCDQSGGLPRLCQLHFGLYERAGGAASLPKPRLCVVLQCWEGCGPLTSVICSRFSSSARMGD